MARCFPTCQNFPNCREGDVEITLSDKETLIAHSFSLQSGSLFFKNGLDEHWVVNKVVCNKQINGRFVDMKEYRMTYDRSLDLWVPEGKDIRIREGIIDQLDNGDLASHQHEIDYLTAASYKTILAILHGIRIEMKEFIAIAFAEMLFSHLDFLDVTNPILSRITTHIEQYHSEQDLDINTARWLHVGEKFKSKLIYDKAMGRAVNLNFLQSKIPEHLEKLVRASKTDLKSEIADCILKMFSMRIGNGTQRGEFDQIADVQRAWDHLLKEESMFPPTISKNGLPSPKIFLKLKGYAKRPVNVKVQSVLRATRRSIYRPKGLEEQYHHKVVEKEFSEFLDAIVKIMDPILKYANPARGDWSNYKPTEYPWKTTETTAALAIELSPTTQVETDDSEFESLLLLGLQA